jgi:hypothetical protein
MTAILAGSTSKPFLHTICANNSPKGVLKMHFLMFNEILHCLHLSNMSLNTYTWSFNRLYTIQSSGYTSRN